MKLPIIVFCKKHPSNILEICIVGETKKDGVVRYTYKIPNNAYMQMIINKKVFQFKDWNFIKETGKLIKREICNAKENN